MIELALHKEPASEGLKQFQSSRSTWSVRPGQTDICDGPYGHCFVATDVPDRRSVNIEVLPGVRAQASGRVEKL